MLLRTPFSAEQVKAALMHDPALAGLGLVDLEGRNALKGNQASLLVRPWEEDDHDLIGDGFKTAAVTITIIAGRGEEDWVASHRLLAAILRLVPGDVCLASQDAGGPDLLRLDGIVYISPDGFEPEEMTDFGYYPERIVAGIPARTVEAAQ